MNYAETDIKDKTLAFIAKKAVSMLGVDAFICATIILEDDRSIFYFGDDEKLYPVSEALLDLDNHIESKLSEDDVLIKRKIKLLSDVGVEHIAFIRGW
jgi:hypothetical protein